MDERPTSPGTHDTNVNTTLHLSNGPSLRRTSSSRPGSASSPDGSVLTPHQFQRYLCTLSIVSDSKGYGMKVSGDNPVYVQSVKEGGAAEKAGLRFGDKIIKVNGIDVQQSTHIEVVELIKASAEVQLTVRQRIPNTRPPQSSTPLNHTLNNRCTSPLPKPPTSPNPVTPSTMNHSSNIQRPLHHHHSAPARDRITAPQPVDHEKLRQLECQREQTFRLMLEKEQRYAEALRSELAKCTDASNEQQILRDLTGAERRIRTLQEQLNAITSNHFNTLPSHANNNGLIDVQLPPTPPPPPPLSTLPSRLAAHTSTPISECSSANHMNNDVAPPLPSRNRSLTSPVPVPSPRTNSPPPLPPRHYLHSPVSNVEGTPQDTRVNAAMSTDLGSPTSPLPIHHQRTKSNPDRISNNMSISLPAEENTSGSLCDLRSVKRSKGGVSWNVDSPLMCTPPGTPPPPYHGTPQHHKENSVPSPPVPPPPDEIDEIDKDDIPSRARLMSTDLSTPNATIISMEDDDMSDQDTSQLSDLGSFKNMNKVMQHNMHLAVFLNYVLSNCDPSCILFYLVTELYREGNMKEMRKWAYEIHSSFLGPGAPLRLNNVDENIARSIDRVLEKQSDHETKLRQVFAPARTKAKQELNEQLLDFQQKKTAGLATIYGPNDTVLDECIHDKSKELKLIEQYLVPKMEPLIEELDKEVVDDRKYTMAAALGTILAKHFGIRGQHFNSLMERCPTFVSKEKSFKARIIGRSRKVTTRGHHFVAQQFFTVTLCVHCQLIIRGIGPQGYQCSTCRLPVHRSCVKVFEENCVGPISSKNNKTSGISKFVKGIRPERLDAKRKPSFPQIDKIRKQTDDREESSATDSESAEKSGGTKGSRANANSNSLVDTLKEADEKLTSKLTDGESHVLRELTPQKPYSRGNKSSCAAINRSESYKERISQKRPIRDKRKTSDPNLSKTNTDVEIDSNAQYLYPTTNSASSSNSNSTRSLDSPSNSLEAVGSSNKGSCENTAIITDVFNQSGNLSRSINQGWESDLEAETDPADAIESVPPDVLNNLTPSERKRQDVINELFVTEESHVRALKVLDNVFYKPMKLQQVLPDEHLQLLFPNLDQLLIIHLQLHMLMKARKKENPVVGEVGDILIKTFDGSEGESFKKAAATFCCRQKVALEKLKQKRSKKDSPLHNFLKEAEMNPLCKRLQLQDIIPTEMQRLTKYPLLFENLAKYSKSTPDEEKNVRRALKRSKEILNRIDEAVREAADIDQIAEILRKLDMTAFDKSDPALAAEFRNLDFSKLKIVHQGSLNLKTSKKTIEVHAILLENIIILFQKAHEKYLLQSFPSSGPPEQITSPLIKVASMHISQNAVDRRELYLIEPQGGQMCVLVASSQNEGNKWFKRISETTEAHKKDGSKHKPPLSVHDVDHCGNGSKATETKENNSSHGSSDSSSGIPVHTKHSHDDSIHAGQSTEAAARKSGGGGGGDTSPGQRKKRTANDPPRLTTEVSLIEPSQVSVSQQTVLTAESVLTSNEILRRNCGTIDVLTRENLKIVADLLHVAKDEFDTLNESVTEAVSFDKEPTELVRGAYKEVDQLTSLLNKCLCVTEEEAIAAGCETMSGANSLSLAKQAQAVAAVAAAASASNSMRTLPSIPATRLQPITQRLRGYLATLVTTWTEREEERERQRLELQRCREQLHAMHEEQQRRQRATESSVHEESSPPIMTNQSAAEEPVKPGLQ